MGLVKLRAYQINGCAYCVDMHYGELKKIGIPDDQLNLVVAWRESLCFSGKERVALKWAESVTLISKTHSPDEDYDFMEEHFSEKELVDLTILIGQINLWNRLAISFKLQPQVKKSLH
jgi:AhpD family alkylhydroperoxidase